MIDRDTSISVDGIPIMPEIAEAIDAAVVIPDTPVQAVTEGLGEVAVDTAKLFELQVQLFESECAQSAQKLTQPLLIILSGVTCGTASLMIVFHALGWALHDILGWSVSLSLGIVGVVGAALTALAFQIGLAELKKPRISFAKSKAELMQNFRVYANLLSRPK